MDNDFDNEKLVNSLHWHFLSKNFSLKKVLTFRQPMHIDSHNEMAHCYSQYFVNLMAATDILYNEAHKYSEDFRNSLANDFVFDGFSNGLDNYGYLLELRNSIVHRGLILANQAVCFKTDFPLVFAPPTVKSRPAKNGSKQYSAFGKYLFDIIQKCEQKVGPIIVSHLHRNGLLNSTTTKEELLQAAISFLNNSDVPNEVKEQGVAYLSQIDLIAAHEESMREMVKLIGTNTLPT